MYVGLYVALTIFKCVVRETCEMNLWLFVTLQIQIQAKIFAVSWILRAKDTYQCAKSLPTQHQTKIRPKFVDPDLFSQGQGWPATMTATKAVWEIAVTKGEGRWSV